MRAFTAVCKLNLLLGIELITWNVGNSHIEHTFTTPFNGIAFYYSKILMWIIYWLKFTWIILHAYLYFNWLLDWTGSLINLYGLHYDTTPFCNHRIMYRLFLNLKQKTFQAQYLSNTNVLWGKIIYHVHIYEQFYHAWNRLRVVLLKCVKRYIRYDISCTPTLRENLLFLV